MAGLNGQHRVNEWAMRRALVLTTESARHPFRKGMPPHVFKLADIPPASRTHNFRDFMLVFAASFAGIYSYIA